MSGNKQGIHNLSTWAFTSHQSTKSMEKRKFQPQLLNFAELRDSPADSSSQRAQVSNKSRTGNSEASVHVKKLPQLKPFVYNAADWEDSPPTSVKSKSTAKRVNEATRHTTRFKSGAAAARVPLHNRISQNGLSTKSSVSFKAKTKVEQLAKGARKELFTGKQSIMLGKTYSQTSTAKRNLAPPCLDITEPLIDINAAEAALFQKPLQKLGRNTFNRQTKFNQATALASILFKVPVTKKPLPPPFKTRFNNLSRQSNKSESSSSVTSLSKSMNEFVENEKQCFTESASLQLQKIQNILGSEHRSFDKLQKKYKDVRSSMDEFCREHENFQKLYIENRKLISKIIESSEDHKPIEDISRPSPHGASTDSYRSPLLSVLENKFIENGKKSTRKTVAFNLNFECEDSENFCLDDKVVQKSLKSYNLLRKNFTAVLGTPKGDKFNVRTPKSGKKLSEDSISNKIQRQLFMLNNTPRRKLL